MDPRVHIVEKPGFSWDTYQYLDDSGLLSDVHEVPWEDGGACMLTYSQVDIPLTLSIKQCIPAFTLFLIFVIQSTGNSWWLSSCVLYPKDRGYSGMVAYL
jgi:hypothetical protein